MKLLSVVLLCLAFCILRSQTIIHVNHAATGLGHGGSWVNAFTSLQSALEVAAAGDEIWVAQGTYYPSKDTGNVVTQARQKYFSLIDSVKIYGGFDGTESLRSQRDFRNNPTILSGDLGIKGDSSDNSYHVVVAFDNDLSRETILDGFTITKGYANGSQDFNWLGGGILIYGPSEAIFKNLIVVDNRAAQGGGVGISADQFLSIPPFGNRIQFVNCELNQNTSTADGGGVWCQFNNAQYTNCLIVGNKALGATFGKGGGIYSYYSRSVLYHSTISDNTALFSPGIRSFGGNYYTGIFNCIINDLSNHSGSSSDCEYQNSIANGSGGSSNWQGSTLKARDLGGNLDISPAFVPGGYSLQYSSLAREGGSLNRLPLDSFDLDNDGDYLEFLPLDFEGRRRLVHNKPDMGAFEYRSTNTDSTSISICPGDSLNYAGQYVDTNGIYSRLLSTGPNGDSVEYMILTIDSVNTALDFGLFGGDFTSLEDSASYQWINCGTGAVLTADTFQTYTPTKNGIYAVIITSKLGCVDTSECVWIYNVGLNEHSHSVRLEVYPNPAISTLSIESETGFPENAVEVVLYNMTGKAVLKEAISTEGRDEVELDVSALASGVYTLSVLNQQHRIVKTE